MQNKLLRQKAYEKIKKAIVTLRFEMGKSLNEKELSTEFKLGRTPIREALQQLANEGLVVVVPRKGVYVSTVSLTDFHKLLDARIMLETYCARKAATRITREMLDHLRQIMASTEPLIVARDIDALLTLDRQIHMAAVESLANQYIEQIASQLYDRVARLWYLSFKNLDEPELRTRLLSHQRIIDALDHRDPDLAEKEVRQHNEMFVDRIYKKLGTPS
ncbi:MAG TPA: GntR family transcriptional regulator [Thermodesulfobacteriota bacterium]|nr:GntR family transcriptional regulator [Thermodesulfobacteriota bacterium]